MGASATNLLCIQYCFPDYPVALAMKTHTLELNLGIVRINLMCDDCAECTPYHQNFVQGEHTIGHLKRISRSNQYTKSHARSSEERAKTVGCRIVGSRRSCRQTHQNQEKQNEYEVSKELLRVQETAGLCKSLVVPNMVK